MQPAPRPFPPGTTFTWVLDYIDRSGDCLTQSITRRSRAEAVKAAHEFCSFNLRRFQSLTENWEIAVLPEAYPGQPLGDRVIRPAQLLAAE